MRKKEFLKIYDILSSMHFVYLYVTVHNFHIRRKKQHWRKNLHKSK